MRFKVYRLRRSGRRLPWRDVVNEAPQIGELIMHLVTSRGRQYSVASTRTTGFARCCRNGAASCRSGKTYKG